MPAYKVREYRATEEFYKVEAANADEAIEIYCNGSHEPYSERTIHNNVEVIEEEQ